MSDDKVVTLDVATTLDIPLERLRDNIEWEQLDTVLIIAFDKNDELRGYSNKAISHTHLYMMEMWKHKLLRGDFG